MTDSSKANADYARCTDAATTAAEKASPQSALGTWPRRFRPRLLPTLAAVVLVTLFISAGQWQWNKYMLKTDRQSQLDARMAQAEIRMSTALVDPQSLRYRRIVARGHFEPKYQILIDNRIHRSQAGFHLITPLRLEGSETRLLINRGWVPALAVHRDTPSISTPSGLVEVSGTAIVPGARFFTLGSEGAGGGKQWQTVWQNLDLERYVQAVGFPIQPVVIQLDAESSAGGFVREWPRADERLQTNLGYALQWWAFAATTVALWLVVNFRK